MLAWRVSFPPTPHLLTDSCFLSSFFSPLLVFPYTFSENLYLPLKSQLWCSPVGRKSWQTHTGENTPVTPIRIGTTPASAANGFTSLWETTAAQSTPLGTWAHLPLPRIVSCSPSTHAHQTQMSLPQEALPGTRPHPSPKQHQVLVLSSTQPWRWGGDCTGAFLGQQVVYAPVPFLRLSNCFRGKGHVSFFFLVAGTW